MPIFPSKCKTSHLRMWVNPTCMCLRWILAIKQIKWTWASDFIVPHSLDHAPAWVIFKYRLFLLVWQILLTSFCIICKAVNERASWSPRACISKYIKQDPEKNNKINVPHMSGTKEKRKMAYTRSKKTFKVDCTICLRFSSSTLYLSSGMLSFLPLWQDSSPASVSTAADI